MIASLIERPKTCHMIRPFEEGKEHQGSMADLAGMIKSHIECGWYEPK